MKKSMGLSSKLRIITAHDGNQPYKEMAEVAEKYAKKNGYNLEVRIINNVKKLKPILLLNSLTENWSVWMDSDSIIIKPIDELFTDDYDLVFAIKEPEFRSKKFGSYLYSGFIIARNTENARRFLKEWDDSQVYDSDQRNLNHLLKDYLDDSIYEKVYHIITVKNNIKIKLVDPNRYVHQKSIHQMKAAPSEVKILHFKGALQKKWKEYKCLL